MLRTVETMKEKHLDLDDAIQYSAAMSLGVKAIVSFDKRFDGPEEPRAEPARLVGRETGFPHQFAIVP